MSVTFQDYYATLGVARTANADDIQRAYRKLAREFHPDVNKSPDASKKFGQINEAYEVLKDPKKRERYDALGADWKNGQEFRPPPGWGQAGGRGPRPGGRSRAAGPGAGSFDFSSSGSFSDFFESFFGGGGMPGGGGMGDMDEAFGRASSGPRRGQDEEAEVTIPLLEAHRGGSRQFTLQGGSRGDASRTFTVKIPPGTTDGSAIRLAGQGSPGQGGGPAGDLILRVLVAPDPRFKVSDRDLTTVVPIAPWEAALGAKVAAPTLDGEVTLTVPPGSSSGTLLRLRGKGLARRQGSPGDLIVELRVVVPKQLSPEEKALFEQLREKSAFKARSTES